MGFTVEDGPRLDHKGLMGTVFPSLQKIIIGNRLIGDVGCITPSLTSIQTLFYKDMGLSGLSFLGPSILTYVLKEFSDSYSYLGVERKCGSLLCLKLKCSSVRNVQDLSK